MRRVSQKERLRLRYVSNSQCHIGHRIPPSGSTLHLLNRNRLQSQGIGPDDRALRVGFEDHRTRARAVGERWNLRRRDREPDAVLSGCALTRALPRHGVALAGIERHQFGVARSA